MIDSEHGDEIDHRQINDREARHQIENAPPAPLIRRLSILDRVLEHLQRQHDEKVDEEKRTAAARPRISAPRKLTGPRDDEVGGEDEKRENRRRQPRDQND